MKGRKSSLPVVHPDLSSFLLLWTSSHWTVQARTPTVAVVPFPSHPFPYPQTHPRAFLKIFYMSHCPLLTTVTVPILYVYVSNPSNHLDSVSWLLFLQWSCLHSPSACAHFLPWPRHYYQHWLQLFPKPMINLFIHSLNTTSYLSRTFSTTPRLSNATCTYNSMVLLHFHWDSFSLFFSHKLNSVVHL